MSTLSTTNIKHPSSASNNIVLDSSGRVGIGTSPTSAGSRNTLTVNGASGSDFYLKHNGTEVLSIQCTSSSAAALNYPSSGNFYINRAGTGVAEFDGSGNLKFNSGYGSVATAYGCRAWVNFNGTGTVAIRASGNVSSITDNGTGNYTVNFTTALADANYSVVASSNSSSGWVTAHNTLSTSSANVRTYDATTSADSSAVCVSIFR